MTNGRQETQAKAVVGSFETCNVRFSFFFPLGIVFSPLTPPDCNFKFLRCNGTERLNFFCEFLGDGGGEGREREKKERIIPLAHAIVCSRNFNKNTVGSLLAGVVWMGK